MTDHRTALPARNKGQRAMRRGLAGLGFGLALALAAPVQADDPRRGEEDPGALALESIERLMRALDAFVRTIPQYELPELTEEGDIIIRRRPPRERPEPAPRDLPEPESTET